jgi:hypothetical protein
MERFTAMWAAEVQTNFLSWDYKGKPAEADSSRHNLEGPIREVQFS